MCDCICPEFEREGVYKTISSSTGEHAVLLDLVYLLLLNIVQSTAEYAALLTKPRSSQIYKKKLERPSFTKLANPFYQFLCLETCEMFRKGVGQTGLESGIGELPAYKECIVDEMETIAEAAIT